jgi:hypothetical protein
MSLLVLESDGIARVVSVLPLEAENLFAAWIGFVVNTELCRVADLVVELNFHIKALGGGWDVSRMPSPKEVRHFELQLK